MTITQKKFEGIVKKFSSAESLRSALWYRSRNLLVKGYEMEAYILILATWNFADFRYFLTNFNLTKFNNTINVITTWASDEKAKTIAYQKKGWADGKAQLAKNWLQIKNLFNWTE